MKSLSRLVAAGLFGLESLLLSCHSPETDSYPSSQREPQRIIPIQNVYADKIGEKSEKYYNTDGMMYRDIDNKVMQFMINTDLDFNDHIMITDKERMTGTQISLRDLMSQKSKWWRSEDGVNYSVWLKWPDKTVVMNNATQSVGVALDQLYQKRWEDTHEGHILWKDNRNNEKNGGELISEGNFKEYKENAKRISEEQLQGFLQNFSAVRYMRQLALGERGHIIHPDGSFQDAFLFWNMLSGPNDKPFAVTYLGPEKPGSTSTPFSLDGNFYHFVYDPNAFARLSVAGKWRLKKLK